MHETPSIAWKTPISRMWAFCPPDPLLDYGLAPICAGYIRLWSMRRMHFTLPEFIAQDIIGDSLTSACDNPIFGALALALALV